MSQKNKLATLNRRLGELERELRSPLDPAGGGQAGELTISQSRSISHSGPIPHPEVLGGYGAINPGFPERVVTMAEKEQAHRHAMDKVREANAAGRDVGGRRAAFVSVLIFAAVATYAIHLGHAVEGAAILGAEVVGLVVAFVQGRPNEKKPSAPS